MGLEHSVRTGLLHRYLTEILRFLSGNRSECLLCHSHTRPGFSSALARDNSGWTENRGKTAFDETKRKPPEKLLPWSFAIYQNAAYLGTRNGAESILRLPLHRGLLCLQHMVCSRLPFIRRFAVPLLLQAVISVSVDMPLPGGIGISEIYVPEIFRRSGSTLCFFRQWSFRKCRLRGLLVGAVFTLTIVAQHDQNTKREKEGNYI